MNYILNPDSISFPINGTIHIINRSDNKFHSAIGIIYDPIYTEPQKISRLTTLVDDWAFISAYLSLDGSLVNPKAKTYGNIGFSTLKKLIDYSNTNEIPYEITTKLINNVVNNPKASMILGMFFNFSLLLTTSGNFYIYKGVRENFTDVYSGTILNRAGMVIEMPEEKIVDGYGPGLHFGDYGFATRMSRGHINLCEVDVNDIVYLYGCEIKVKRYKVIEENSPNRKVGVYDIECIPYVPPVPKEITLEDTFETIRKILGNRNYEIVG